MLESAIERVVGSVLKTMRVPALRSAVEQYLHRMVATFSFGAAIPNLQVWHTGVQVGNTQSCCRHYLVQLNV